MSKVAIIDGDATVDYSKFNLTLVRFIRSLQERCADDQELVQLFREAINSIEVADSLKMTHGEPRALFRQHFLDKRLVRAVRDRNPTTVVEVLHEIGRKEESELLQALSSLDVRVSAGDTSLIPWNTLGEMYLLGAQMDVTTEVPPRVYAFNALYEDFLDNMSTAFPHAENKSLLPAFRTACLWSPTKIIEEFKKHAAPFIQAITSRGSLPSEDSLPDIYSDPATVFGQLPFVKQLPLAAYWQQQVLDNEENYKYLAETFTQLVMGALGLPAQMFSSSTLANVQQLVMQKLEEKGIDGSASSADQDMGQIFSMAMEIMQSMQETGQMDELLGGFGFGGAGSEATLDVDTDLLTSLSQNMNLPPDLQLMIDAAAVQDQPIAASLGGAKEK